MRSIARLPFAVVAVVLLCLAAATARAQNLPSGYASYGDFIAGAWKYERQEPRQTMWMRFEQGGVFNFDNTTIELKHWGTYTIKDGELLIVINRSCDPKSCENRSPPLTLTYRITPVDAAVFTSGSERWERQAK
jgi:hypothetical protein